MIEIGKTYVVNKGKFHGEYVTTFFLQQNMKFLCRFHKGTEPPFAFKEKELLTVEEWEKHEKRENQDHTI